MQKLKLDLDSLHVDSFETSHASATPRGTVEANQDSAYCSAATACNCNSTIFTWSCQDANTDTIPDGEGPRISQISCTHEN